MVKNSYMTPTAELKFHLTLSLLINKLNIPFFLGFYIEKLNEKQSSSNKIQNTENLFKWFTAANFE